MQALSELTTKKRGRNRNVSQRYLAVMISVNCHAEQWSATKVRTHCPSLAMRFLRCSSTAVSCSAIVALKSHNALQRRVVLFHSASNPRFAGNSPGSDHEELWRADIKACAPGGECRIFKDVLFVESQETVYLYGLEHEDGRPKELKAEQTDPQQLFVEFVRKQTELTLAMMGLLARHDDEIRKRQGQWIVGPPSKCKVAHTSCASSASLASN